ncbi:HalD/BesD family halogenase [Cupriavidus sp. 30B13]|uniref:HalD/BesD family halogenase n=1 Tax=Cupriavidus sp. 30B13 TaxID=3384241 RepID=UPI003B8EBDED
MSEQATDEITLDAPAPAARKRAPALPDPDASVAERTRRLDSAKLRADFARQGAFLNLQEFLAPEVTAQLIAAARALMPDINRNYLPGHKQGGSVSRHTIDEKAPFIAELYRSRALISWLEQMCGDKLLPSPQSDPHAYALYYYTRAGDHIGWHYDTSYYDGRRYTLLLGVIDESTCRLDYELHTRNPDVPDEPGTVQIAPGGLVFFDGDKLRHRVTPAGEGEVRVSLTFEYVTDPGMRPWLRFISNMKDAVAYFGFRQVFKNLVSGKKKPRA